MGGCGPHGGVPGIVGWAEGVSPVSGLADQAAPEGVGVDGVPGVEAVEGAVSEPLFVFCTVCRRHVKRGPDSTLAVTLQRHKASVHGLGGPAQSVAAERTG